MSEGRVVIVGAGPAGLSCARSYRRHGGRLPVTMLGEERDAPYERPALSKGLLRGEVARTALSLESPEFFAENDVDLRVGCRAVGLDLDQRELEIDGGELVQFEGCLLATGARAAVPDIPGTDDDRVATLRYPDDAERLRRVATKGLRVLVVGSGFIGCEAAASMAQRGARVTLATMEGVPQEDRLGPDVGARIAAWLDDAGVDLVADFELTAINPNGRAVTAVFGERRIDSDLVLLALGVRRNGELGASAGLAMEGDAIRTDQRLRTAADGIYAAGDVAMAFNPTANRRIRVEHWGEALRQGEVAGAALAGSEDEAWTQAPGFWSEIGRRTLKYVAWGDGFEDVQLTDHPGGGFTAHYVRGGELVGVLTHEADADYERGRVLVEARVSWI